MFIMNIFNNKLCHPRKACPHENGERESIGGFPLELTPCLTRGQNDRVIFEMYSN